MPNLVSRDKVVKTSNKSIFDFGVPNAATYINCYSPNMIYLDTCSRPSLQYVGETFHEFNKRFNWHRIGFNQPGKYGLLHSIRYFPQNSMMQCFLFSPNTRTTIWEW